MTSVSGVQPVRLSPDELQGILDVTEQVTQRLGIAWRTILLFGSRCRMDARGGDIDLAWTIESSLTSDQKASLSRALKLSLLSRLGEQKLDIVILGSEDQGPFEQMVRNSGVILWQKPDSKKS